MVVVTLVAILMEDAAVAAVVARQFGPTVVVHPVIELPAVAVVVGFVSHLAAAGEHFLLTAAAVAVVAAMALTTHAALHATSHAAHSTFHATHATFHTAHAAATATAVVAAAVVPTTAAFSTGQGRVDSQQTGECSQGCDQFCIRMGHGRVPCKNGF
jgi:hypothetical protein